MIDPLASFNIPRQRLSMPALVTVGTLHVALLWLMLQSGPAVQATRQMVIQYFSPITQMRDKPTPSPPPAIPAPVPSVQTPVPPPVPVEQAPAPIIHRMEAVTPQRATVKIKDTKRVPDVSINRIEQILVPPPTQTLPLHPPLNPPRALSQRVAQAPELRNLYHWPCQADLA